jgi:hypothetical protein
MNRPLRIVLCPGILRITASPALTWGSSIRVQQSAGICRSETSESVSPGPVPVISKRTRAVHEARKLCPGHTELRPVPALTARAGPQSFSGDLGRPNAGRGPGGSKKGSTRDRGLDGPVSLFSLRRCLAEGGRKRDVGNSESLASISHGPVPARNPRISV